MVNSSFSFKQFTIEQGHAAMKVGTDGVLLGAWCDLHVSATAPIGGIAHVLDIGTGTGIIALMIAQRLYSASQPYLLDAVEAASESCLNARLNFERTRWNNQITLYEETFQQFTKRFVALPAVAAPNETSPIACEKPETIGSVCGIEKTYRYERIVSNPPYFTRALPSPQKGRNQARHAVNLPYETLLQGVTQLLAPEGIFSVILPPQESAGFQRLALEHDLHVVRQLNVHSKPESPVKRILTEYGHGPWVAQKGFQREMLTIKSEREGEYNEAYKALTRDFYLNF